MKRLNLILATAILCFNSFSSFSQEKTPEERAKHLTEKMTKSLLLSTDQQAKVLTLNTGIAQKNDAIRKNVNMSKEQKQEAIKGNMEARKSNLKMILNEEQYKKFEKLEEKRKEEFKKKHKEQKQDTPPPADAPKPDEL
jgi:protein CpxP